MATERATVGKGDIDDEWVVCTDVEITAPAVEVEEIVDGAIAVDDKSR